LPNEILIHEAFNYSGVVIISLFLLLYESKITKHLNKGNKKDKEEEMIKKCRSNNEIEYIFNDAEILDISFMNLFGIVISLFLCIQLKNVFFIFSLDGLDFFWIFELLFVCYVNYKLFGIPVYRHKKCSIIFIIIVCTTLDLLTLKGILNDDKEERLYKYYKWIIPIGIIFFLLNTYLRAYTFCKIKWIIDIKFYSPIKFLLLYGLTGALICFGFSIISHNIPCVDVNSFTHISLICTVNKTDNNNNTINYYDNFSIYFSSFGNAKYVFLYIFKIITSYGVKLYSILIIKYLSPEYLICINSFYFFITGMIDSIYYLSKGINTKKETINGYKYIDIAVDLLHFLGSVIYLEFIELKFCKLNYYLKKNIAKRSEREMITEMSINETNVSYIDNED
jgi:hypothetical protein